MKLIRRPINIIAVKKKKQDDPKSRLLSAARTLFNQRGFDAASTREIAARAGCNLALISYYFGSKEGLLTAIVRAEMEEGTPDLLGALCKPGTASEQLAQFIDLAIDHFADDGDFLRISHREIIQRESRFLDSLVVPIERVIGELADRFKDPNVRGATAGQDSRLTALLLVGTMQFYFLAYPLTSKLVGKETNALKREMKRQIISLFIGSEAPNPKDKSPEVSIAGSHAGAMFLKSTRGLPRKTKRRAS